LPRGAAEPNCRNGVLRLCMGSETATQRGRGLPFLYYLTERDLTTILGGVLSLQHGRP
jgi:hypothetical protein